MAKQRKNLHISSSAPPPPKCPTENKIFDSAFILTSTNKFLYVRILFWTALKFLYLPTRWRYFLQFKACSKISEFFFCFPQGCLATEIISVSRY